MPALFGDKPISDKGQAILRWVDKIAIALNILVPGACYAFLLDEKILYKSRGYDGKITWTYVSLSFTAGFLLFIEAIMLLYAVIKIRVILGKNGLQQRVNVSMFIVNALLFLFQVISLYIWYFAYASFSVKFYNQ